MHDSTTPYVSYSTVAKILHWVIAVAIIGMLAFGWMLDDMPRGAEKFKLMQLHKSIGITILILSVVRLGWRLFHVSPPLPASMALWERRVATITHVAFYALMIGIPMAGWAMVSASSLNIPTLLFGVVPWPHLPILPDLPNKQEYGHFFGEVHELLAFGIVGLLVLHVGAALKHHFIVKDDVVLRMAPRFMTGLLLRLRGEK